MLRNANILKMKQKCILHGLRQSWQVLGTFKLLLKELAAAGMKLILPKSTETELTTATPHYTFKSFYLKAGIA
jgi:hypothetical protein